MTKKELSAINDKALKIINRYQNIRTPGGKVLATPYFINAVEIIYKNIFAEVGVDPQLIADAVKKIRKGKTSLGNMVGKGTPEQIEISTARVSRYMQKKYGIDIEIYPKREVRGFLRAYHIGIDCSGLVYNILKYSLGENLYDEVSKSFAWQDPKNKRATQAGVFVFNADNLFTVENYLKLQPLDLVIFKDNTHMGILIESKGNLYLVDSSTNRGGITFSRVFVKDPTTLEFEGRDIWNTRAKEGELSIKRIPQLKVDND